MYMGYSAAMGSCEGAILIFANSAKEAKKLFWKNSIMLDIDEYIDMKVILIKDKPFLEKEKKYDYPHIVEFPTTCWRCDMWGEEIGEDGLCDDCRELEEDSYTVMESKGTGVRHENL